MPPALLVNIVGSPYPPAIQRLVPGRENCTGNELVPLMAINGAEDNEDGLRQHWQPPPLSPNWQRNPIVPTMTRQTIEAQARRQADLATKEEAYYSSERKKHLEITDQITERLRNSKKKQRKIVLDIPRLEEPDASLDDMHLSKEDEEYDPDYVVSNSDEEDDWI